jgi:glutaredoxin-related protein
MCGFSKAVTFFMIRLLFSLKFRNQTKKVVNILQFHGAPFESHNVLADESIRSGIKEYTGVYINPEFPTLFAWVINFLNTD